MGLGQRGTSIQKEPGPLLSPPPSSHCPVSGKLGKHRCHRPRPRWSQHHPEPPEGGAGSSAPRAAGRLGRRKVPERALPAPLPRPGPPGLHAGGRPLPDRTVPAAALGCIPLGCRLPLSAEGSTKCPPQPSAISCLRRAGEEGGRSGRPRGDHCPRRPWGPGPSPAPPRPRPALARPPWTWHRPTSWQGGRERRPLAQPRPASPGGRRCCRPEPGGAVIKAMLLGSLGPERTALEVTPARVGVARWTL